MILPLWLRVSVAVLLLSIVFGGLYAIYCAIDKRGYNRAVAERAVTDNEAIAQRIAENHDEQAAQELWRITKDKEFNDEISKLRTRVAAADRLRVSNGCSGSATKAEGKSAPGGNGGDSGTRLVSQATQRDFDALELRVEQVFAGCRIAQEFIRKHE